MRQLWLLSLLAACGGDDAAISVDAATPDAAPSDASPIDGPPATLTKHPAPVLGGPTEVASDPSVRRTSDGLEMVYTCLPEGVHTALCRATSTDGITWQRGGTLLEATAPETALEGSELVVVDGEPVIFASTYGATAVPAVGFPARLLRATDVVVDVLGPTAGPDCHAVYSPTIRGTTNALSMVYVGHCYADPQPAESTGGLALRGATSTDGGVTWTRQGRVVVPDPTVSWQVHGLAEPGWIENDPEGRLLVTGGFGEGEGQRVAIARPQGAMFVVDREPLLVGTPGTHDACGILAPSARIEGGLLRIWYLAVACDTGSLSIGYAEGPSSVLER